MTECPRCHGWRWKENTCSCKLIGKVWEPDCGDNEENADEVWSVHRSPEDALDKWCERRDSDCAGEAFQNEVTVAFRSTGGALLFLTITREYEPTYHVWAAEEDEAERIAAVIEKQEV